MSASVVLCVRRRLPRMHNIPPEADFDYSRFPAKSELELDPIWTLMQCFLHDLLSLNTRIVDMGYWSWQAFVTRFVTHCHCWCQLVYRPQNVRSADSHWIWVLEDDVRANFWYVSHRFPVLSFGVVIFDARCADFVLLLHFLFASSQ